MTNHRFQPTLVPRAAELCVKLKCIRLELVKWQKKEKCGCHPPKQVKHEAPDYGVADLWRQA
ncbi:MAG: hypothetical protein BWK80_48595 [Desulfobacteraceae bacterium IS3]|nr:MAG: hypothetical protein BWK80_48595 [Desulfobacteraceae bacterium IS3]